MPLKGCGGLPLSLASGHHADGGWWRESSRGTAEQQDGRGPGPWCRCRRARSSRCLMWETRDLSAHCSNCCRASLAPPAPLRRTWEAPLRPSRPAPAGAHPLHPSAGLGNVLLPWALSKREIWVSFHLLGKLAFLFSFSAGSRGESSSLELLQVVTPPLPPTIPGSSCGSSASRSVTCLCSALRAVPGGLELGRGCSERGRPLLKAAQPQMAELGFRVRCASPGTSFCGSRAGGRARPRRCLVRYGKASPD